MAEAEQSRREVGRGERAGSEDVHSVTQHRPRCSQECRQMSNSGAEEYFENGQAGWDAESQVKTCQYSRLNRRGRLSQV